MAISLVRRQAEKVKAPRFLHCEFPLGRPLGRPNDREFQHEVLRRAFALLRRLDVPVLEDHPEPIEDESDHAAACLLPPRYDPKLHPAVDEALGLRMAYERARTDSGGRTAVGRISTADDLGELIGRFVALADGASLEDVDFDTDSVQAGSQDVRAYYEEAAMALAGHVPAARQVETWLYGVTETGAVLRAASRALERSGADREAWYYLVPGTQR